MKGFVYCEFATVNEDNWEMEVCRKNGKKCGYFDYQPNCEYYRPDSDYGKIKKELRECEIRLRKILKGERTPYSRSFLELSLIHHISKFFRTR